MSVGIAKIKSPLFYMGNKYELIEKLHMYFPKKEEVKQFIDLFGGSGVVVVNSKYEKNIYNELNKNVYELFNLIVNTDENILLSHINKMIKKFDLLIHDTAEKTKGKKEKDKPDWYDGYDKELKESVKAKKELTKEEQAKINEEAKELFK